MHQADRQPDHRDRGWGVGLRHGTHDLALSEPAPLSSPSRRRCAPPLVEAEWMVFAKDHIWRSRVGAVAITRGLLPRGPSIMPASLSAAMARLTVPVETLYLARIVSLEGSCAPTRYSPRSIASRRSLRTCSYGVRGA